MSLLAISQSAAESVVSALLWLPSVYALLGLLFYVAYVAKGLRQVDDTTHGSPKLFFLLILPGIVALWPLLLRKWYQHSKQTAHD